MGKGVVIGIIGSAKRERKSWFACWRTDDFSSPDFRGSHVPGGARQLSLAVVPEAGSLVHGMRVKSVSRGWRYPTVPVDPPRRRRAEKSNSFFSSVRKSEERTPDRH